MIITSEGEEEIGKKWEQDSDGSHIYHEIMYIY